MSKAELYRSLTAGGDSHTRSILYGGGPSLTNSLGVPWTTAYVDSRGDPSCDLRSNIAVESRAKIIYERLINVTDDPGIKDALGFLMTREIAHQKSFEKALYTKADTRLTGKIDLPITPLGSHRLKNIAESVRLSAVHPGGGVQRNRRLFKKSATLAAVLFATAAISAAIAVHTEVIRFPYFTSQSQTVRDTLSVPLPHLFMSGRNRAWKLAAYSQGQFHSDNAYVLAKGKGTVDLAAGTGHVGATAGEVGILVPHFVIHESQLFRSVRASSLRMCSRRLGSIG